MKKTLLILSLVTLAFIAVSCSNNENEAGDGENSSNLTTKYGQEYELVSPHLHWYPFSSNENERVHVPAGSIVKLVGVSERKTPVNIREVFKERNKSLKFIIIKLEKNREFMDDSRLANLDEEVILIQGEADFNLRLATGEASDLIKSKCLIYNSERKITQEGLTLYRKQSYESKFEEYGKILIGETTVFRGYLFGDLGLMARVAFTSVDQKDPDRYESLMPYDRTPAYYYVFPIQYYDYSESITDISEIDIYRLEEGREYSIISPFSFNTSLVDKSLKENSFHYGDIIKYLGKKEQTSSALAKDSQILLFEVIECKAEQLDSDFARYNKYAYPDIKKGMTVEVDSSLKYVASIRK